jgi:hypothetical protein
MKNIEDALVRLELKVGAGASRGSKKSPARSRPPRTKRPASLASKNGA